MNAAHSKQVDVTYMPQQGIHDWPYWRRHLGQAIKWGFFRSVAQDPQRWRFSTVRQLSQAWGLQLRFVKPPGSVATFERSGQFLSGAGSGTVRITRHGGPTVSKKLPFRIPYPQPYGYPQGG